MEAPKQSQKSFITKTRIKPLGLDLFSYENVPIKNWNVKVSVTSNDTILVIMTHRKTNNIQMAFFNDELRAHLYISGVVDGED